jgi:hypothetical protein
MSSTISEWSEMNCVVSDQFSSRMNACIKSVRMQSSPFVCGLNRVIFLGHLSLMAELM